MTYKLYVYPMNSILAGICAVTLLMEMAITDRLIYFGATNIYTAGIVIILTSGIPALYYLMKIYEVVES